MGNAMHTMRDANASNVTVMKSALHQMIREVREVHVDLQSLQQQYNSIVEGQTDAQFSGGVEIDTIRGQEAAQALLEKMLSDLLDYDKKAVTSAEVEAALLTFNEFIGYLHTYRSRQRRLIADVEARKHHTEREDIEKQYQTLTGVQKAILKQLKDQAGKGHQLTTEDIQRYAASTTESNRLLKNMGGVVENVNGLMAMLGMGDAAPRAQNDHEDTKESAKHSAEFETAPSSTEAFSGQFDAIEAARANLSSTPSRTTAPRHAPWCEAKQDERSLREEAWRPSLRQKGWFPVKKDA